MTRLGRRDNESSGRRTRGGGMRREKNNKNNGVGIENIGRRAKSYKDKGQNGKENKMGRYEG